MLWRHVAVCCFVYLASVSGAAVIQQPLRGEQGVKNGAVTDESARTAELRALLSDCWVPSHPIAAPCFRQHSLYNDETCKVVNQNKKIDTWITDQPGGYFFPNWGSCQAHGETCALPQDDNVTVPGDARCHQGSVPDLVVRPKCVEHIKYALEYARLEGMPLVIKNTGHDWKGRSSGPGSLAIWTHHLQTPHVPIVLDEAFVPLGGEGKGKKPEAVFHFGAGEQWGNLYQFAENKSLTVMGGTCGTVGIAGWIQGGGHSPLTPWKGMGVDNVRQLEIMLPNGTVKIANEYTNDALFFAMRGGGGGTYGVITRITYKALEKFPVQSLMAKFSGLDDKLMGQYFDTLTKKAPVWSERGWGGYIKSYKDNTTKALGQNLELINAKSSLEGAREDMKELIAFFTSTKIPYVLRSYASWYDYFVVNLKPIDKHEGGWSGAVASRLLPPTLFSDPGNREDLTDRLLQTYKADVNMWLMLVAPTQFNHTTTSALHPSWKNATWLVRINDRWDQFLNQTDDANRKHFQKAHEEMNRFREIAPGMGVSINEADIWEEEYEDTYWGWEKHRQLQLIKEVVDPGNLLTNHGAVNWDKTNARYRCYPKH